MRRNRAVEPQDDYDEDGFVQEIEDNDTQGQYDEFNDDGDSEASYEPEETDGDWEQNVDIEYEDYGNGEGNIEIEIVHSSQDDGNYEVNIEVINHDGFGSGQTEVYIEHDHQDGDIEISHNQYIGSEEHGFSDEDDVYDDGDIDNLDGTDEFHDNEEDPIEQELEPLLVIVSNDRAYNLDEYNLPPEGTEQIPPVSPQNKNHFEDCSICFNPIFKKGFNACYLECFHWYHFECLKGWCSESRQCPVCRRDFTNILKVK